MTHDQIICRALPFECGIGFYDDERHGLQKILIDFVASVQTIPSQRVDEIDAIQMDYDKAYHVLKDFLQGKRFNLIETIAEKVAELLLEFFPLRGVEVTVTKFPKHLPSSCSVSYHCYRMREAKPD